MNRSTNTAPVSLSTSYLIGSAFIGISMITLKSFGTSRPAGTLFRLMGFPCKRFFVGSDNSGGIIAKLTAPLQHARDDAVRNPVQRSPARPLQFPGHASERAQAIVNSSEFILAEGFMHLRQFQ